jgi:TRAP-type C4-dicarboxylate transport system permease small subunit
MKIKKLIRNLPSPRCVILALFAVVIIAVPVSAFAQSCALCYTQAALSGRQMIEALRSGILILVIPPTLGTVAFLFLVRHRRNQTRRSDPHGPRLDW